MLMVMPRLGRYSSHTLIMGGSGGNYTYEADRSHSTGWQLSLYVSQSDLTSLDADGVAKIGAVQLPGDAQLALWQLHVVLLHVLAPDHGHALAVQAHCTASNTV